jgi:two-component system response regulator YesN
MNKINTLIVDDEKIVREGIGNYIQWDAYDMNLIGMAQNGREALEIIKKEKVDLLITDICMPEMDGLELVAYLKEQPEYPLVLLISGYSDFTYAQAAVSSELIQDYILKPIDFDQMDKVLTKIKGKILKDEDAIIFPVLDEDEWELFMYTGKNIILMTQNKIVGLLEEHNNQKSLRILQQTIETFKKEGKSHNFIARYCIEVALSISELVLDKTGCTQLLRQDPISNISNMKTDKEITDYIKETFEKATQALKREGKNMCSPMVQAAIRHINACYNDVNLSLNVVAEHCKVSPNYLSIKFKEDMGINFIKYLNGLRIQKAKGLLKDISLKVYMVSTAVGYEDVRYFSRIFRTLTGYTPTEYQKKNAQYITYE